MLRRLEADRDGLLVLGAAPLEAADKLRAEKQYLSLRRKEVFDLN